MPKINTKKWHEVCRLFSRRSGRAYALRSDGTVLRRTLADMPWRKHGVLKPGVPISEEGLRRIFKAEVQSEVVKWSRGCQPRLDDIMEMERDGVAETPCGCRVEPDGTCCHGAHSWVTLAMGM